MNRRNFLRSAGAFSLTTLISNPAFTKERNFRPNIFMLVTDDALWDEYQFHNPKTAYTPTMQKLVDEGIYFTNCFAGGSSCSPARFSLFTGRQAGTAIDEETLRTAKKFNGYVKFSNSGKALLEEDNIARIMRDAGYITGIIGKTDGILKGGYKKLDAKDDPDDPEVLKILKENQKIRQEHMKKFGFDYPLYVHRGNIQTYFSTSKNATHDVEFMTKNILDFLDIVKKENKPFFLVYSTSLMHAPKPYEALTTGNPLATEAGSLIKPVTTVQPSRQSCIDRVKKKGIDPDRVAAMLWLDDSLNAIMKKIKKMGQNENTLVILQNDNGHDNHGKDSIYYDGFHVPMIMRWPNGIIKPGRKVKDLVRSFDLVPTLIDLAKTQKPEKMLLHGRSLISFLKNQKPKSWRKSIFMPYGFARAVQKGEFRYIAVRFPDNIDEAMPLDKPVKQKSSKKKKKTLDKKHKALLQIAGKRRGMTQGGIMTKAELNQFEVHGENYFDPDQLYNIKDDPLETKNLAKNPEYAAVLKEMQAELRTYLNQMPGPFGEFKK